MNEAEAKVKIKIESKFDSGYQENFEEAFKNNDLPLIFKDTKIHVASCFVHIINDVATKEYFYVFCKDLEKATEILLSLNQAMNTEGCLEQYITHISLNYINEI